MTVKFILTTEHDVEIGQDTCENAEEIKQMVSAILRNNPLVKTASATFSEDGTLFALRAMRKETSL